MLTSAALRCCSRYSVHHKLLITLDGQPVATEWQAALEAAQDVQLRVVHDHGGNYFEAEAIIAKLMQHYNEERLHATLGYMTPATWHRGQPEQIREQRAGQIAAARARRKAINQQRLTEAA